jgi:hypothetical protein
VSLLPDRALGREPRRSTCRIVASTIANYAGKCRAEGTDPRAAADFMPYLERPAPAAPLDERPLTDDELAAWADATLFGIPPE